jgi:hypothetical protein
MVRGTWYVVFLATCLGSPSCRPRIGSLRHFESINRTTTPHYTCYMSASPHARSPHIVNRCLHVSALLRPPRNCLMTEGDLSRFSRFMARQSFGFPLCDNGLGQSVLRCEGPRPSTFLKVTSTGAPPRLPGNSAAARSFRRSHPRLVYCCNESMPVAGQGCAAAARGSR